MPILAAPDFKSGLRYGGVSSLGLLRGLWYLRGGNSERNSISRNLSTTAGTLVPSAGRMGPALSYADDTENRISVPYPSGNISATGLAFFYYPAVATADNRSLVGTYKPSGGAPTQAQYLSVESGGVLSAFATDADNWNAAAVSLPQFDRDYVAVGTFRYGGGRTLWLNGRRVATTAVARSPGSLGVLLEGAYVDPTLVYDSPYYGLIYLAAWWTRVLSDEEIRFVSANPWCLFVRELSAARVPSRTLRPALDLSVSGWSAV